MKRWLFTFVAVSALLAALARADHHTTAAVTVTVPVGATLTIDGKRTEQMSAVRQFVSPPLAGKATYKFQATYTWDGKVVTKEQMVEVWPGASATVDLHTAPLAMPPAPRPASATEPETLPGRIEPTPRPTAPKVETKPAPKTTEPPAADTTPAPKPKEPAVGTETEKKPEVKKPEIEVPYVPTPEKVVAEMLKLAAVKDGDVVYDLGCGDGRIVIAAVRDFKAKKGMGIDFNPERVKDSKDAAKKAGADVEKKLEFKQGDVLMMTEKDFDGVDVVTLYLLPEVNRKLKPVLQKGLKPGSRVVSHDFDMGDDWKPEKTVMVTDDQGVEHTVYLWTIPDRK